jgi:hypothetical protein
MPSRPTFLIAAALACFGPADGRAYAQARERVAFVTVVDRATGAPRQEVTAGDLVIREDGAAREILRVTRATGPMPVAVIVDTSAEAESAVPDLRNALTAFAGTMGDLGPLAIVGMGARPTVITDYTSTPAVFVAGIGRVFHQPTTGATVIEAIDEVARGLARRESERAALVLVSMGGLEMSAPNYQRALNRLKESGASLHVVMLQLPGRLPLNDAIRERDRLLDRGVRETGGSRNDVLASMSFTPALTDIARLLTHQFRVVYARPQSLIPPSTVTVTATAPGAVAYGGPARGQPK